MRGNPNRMFQARTINAEHKDLIHDVAYDFYGRRMATCSSDQSVKVSWLLFFVNFPTVITSQSVPFIDVYPRFLILMKTTSGGVLQTGKHMLVRCGK